MKNQKAFSLILAFIMIFTFILAGCGSNNNTSDAITRNVESTVQKLEVTKTEASWNTNEKRKIVFSTINNYYTTALKQIAKDYTELHPETEVEIEIIADNETYRQNFTTKIAADKKTAPDIVHTNLFNLDQGELINKGWLAPLDDLLNEENPYNGNKTVKGAINPDYLTLAVSSAGKVSYLPFDLVGVAVFYNQTIFDKAGLKAPSTYEEWIDVCSKLKQAGYESPVGATNFNNWIVTSLADWAFRKNITDLISLPGDGRFNEATMQANVNAKFDPNDAMFDKQVTFDPEKVVVSMKNNGLNNAIVEKIWTTYKNIAQFFPEGWTNPDDGQTYSQFMAQKTPMFVYGSWQVGTILSDMNKLSEDRKFKWGTFKFPKFEANDPNFQGEPRSLLVAGHQIGIAQKDDPEQYYRAADFLKYMYSPEIASRVYDITIKSGEYVQGPSLISGVVLSDEINSYLDGFNVAGNMRSEYADLSGSAHLDADKPLRNDAILKFVSGKSDWAAFVKQLDKFVQNVVNDRMKKFGYDLDPKTADTAPSK